MGSGLDSRLNGPEAADVSGESLLRYASPTPNQARLVANPPGAYLGGRAHTRRRAPSRPRSPNPALSIAHVPGSGTAARVYWMLLIPPL